jgi:hypothetical protein
MHEEPTEQDLIEARLTAYALGELEDSERRAFEQWLTLNAAMADDVESVRALGDRVRAALEGEPAGDGLLPAQRELILRAAAGEPVAVIATIRRVGWSGAGLALAASIGLAFFWPVLFDTGRGTTPASPEYSARMNDATAPGSEAAWPPVATQPPIGAAHDGGDVALITPTEPSPHDFASEAFRSRADEPEAMRRLRMEGAMSAAESNTGEALVADELSEREHAAPDADEQPMDDANRNQTTPGGGGGGSGGAFGGGGGATNESTDAGGQSRRTDAESRTAPAESRGLRPGGAPTPNVPGAHNAPDAAPLSEEGRGNRGDIPPLGFTIVNAALRVRLVVDSDAATDRGPVELDAPLSDWRAAIDAGEWPDRAAIDAGAILSALLVSPAGGEVPDQPDDVYRVDVAPCPWNPAHDLAFLSVQPVDFAEAPSAALEFDRGSVSAFRVIGVDAVPSSELSVRVDAKAPNTIVAIEIVRVNRDHGSEEAVGAPVRVVPVAPTEGDANGVEQPTLVRRFTGGDDGSAEYRRAAAAAAVVLLLRGELPRERATIDFIRSLVRGAGAFDGQAASSSELMEILDRLGTMIEVPSGDE